MKIRMVESGFAGKYTGIFGTVDFVDGVSVDHVGSEQARHLACITSIEWVETGLDAGDNAKYLVNLDKPAVSVNYPTLAEIEAQEAEKVVAETPNVIPSSDYTKAQLEQIADEDGIDGLRKIGDPLHVKGVSIAKLIHGILQAQLSVKPVVSDAQTEG